MGRSLTFLILLAGSMALARAEVRRALLVGIDEYTKPGDASYRLSEREQLRLKAIHGKLSRQTIGNLDGAVNDARSMKELLIRKFGFEERNIVLLANDKATADNILNQMQTHLIDNAKPGDVSLFYYAGHGSRIKNTALRNENSSGLDSTIIPADALLGVPDLRGKELARIFVQAPRKRVNLTVILDSCYSGGASRGAITAHKIRAVPPVAGISVDEQFDGPLPEDQGVLVISASQDYEPAAELTATDLNEPHGAFTWALLHVLGSSPTDDRVDRIFQRTRAVMQSTVIDQEPVLLAKQGCNERGLFGQTAQSSQTVTVAVGQIAGPIIKLNGGLAMNLHEGCELKRAMPGKAAIQIKITKVNGLASSDGIVSAPSSGASRIEIGDLFELETWVAPDRELLRVYVGSPPTAPEYEQLVRTCESLRHLASLIWIDDPGMLAPTHVLSWDAEKSRWMLKGVAADAQPAWIDKISADAVTRLLPASSVKPRLFVLVPPSPEIAAALKFDRDGLQKSIALVDAPDRADYVLAGRLCAGGGPGCVEYAWAIPDLAQPGLRRGSSARPPRSDWNPVDGRRDTLAASLTETALRLARVVGWLELQPPTFDDPWPYRLALRNTRTKQFLSSTEVRGGECYQITLKAAPEALRGAVPTRRIYVFVVDSFGKAKLVFGDNLENEFPRVDTADAPPEVIPLNTVTVSEPYGTDNYFLLTTATPIDNPETVFKFDGVRSRGGEPGMTNPLARLLRNTATGIRGPVGNIPLNWSIQRLTLVSRAPDTSK